MAKNYPLQQLEMIFDYESAGLAKVAKKLKAHAEQIAEETATARSAVVIGYVAIGNEYKRAKEEFKKAKLAKKEDRTWEEWVNIETDRSRSTADKAIRAFEVLGKKTPEQLAGIPIERVNQICAAPARLRNKVLKLAEKHYLAPQHVDEILTEGKDGEVAFSRTIPRDHDELKAYVQKRLRTVVDNKQIDESLRAEVPDVLREIAKELNGK